MNLAGRPAPYLTKVAVAALVMMLAAAVEAKISTDEAFRVFQEANVAFSEANKARGEEADRLYEKAILGYRRLIEDGRISNARLYANLGNAYLMTGDIGRAVLWYRRALALEPANAEISRTLAYARSKRIDRIEPPAERKVLQTLFFWHYDFSSQTRFVLACIAGGILCCALTAVVWVGRRAYLTVAVTLAIVVLAAMAGSLAVEQVQRRPQGVIIANQTVARQGDGENYPEAFKEPLHAGTEFVVLEKRVGWTRIELADSSTGWVRTESVELF
jgi:tetratricopeptide (TPR) repeat protein